MQSVSRMPRLIKVAILCGAVPLLTGTLIYFAWRLTRIDGLMNAGVWTILFGLLAFVAGLGCLFNQSWDADGDLVARRHLRRQGAFALALLLSNFPAAAFYTCSAIDVVTHYTVDVENESDRRIESFVITGPGIRAELGPIAPGRRVQRHFQFLGDGTLDFAAQQQDVQFRGQLDGYVTSGLGGEKSIVVRPDGDYELRPDAR